MNIAGWGPYTVMVVGALAVVIAAVALPWWDGRRATTASGEAARAIRHAGWTAAAGIVCLFGGLLGAVVVAFASLLHGNGRVVGLLPMLTCLLFLAVNALGEITWPRPSGPVREARVASRSVGDITPRFLRRLTIVWAGILATALVAFGLMSSGPRSLSIVSDSGWAVTFTPFPGWWFGVPLLANAVVLVLATEGVLSLIRTRAAVVGVGADWDLRLRRRSARRVLRGTQLALAATLAGVLFFAGLAFTGLGHGMVTDGPHGVIGTGHATAGSILHVAGWLVGLVGVVVAVFPARDLRVPVTRRTDAEALLA